MSHQPHQSEDVTLKPVAPPSLPPVSKGLTDEREAMQAALKALLWATTVGIRAKDCTPAYDAIKALTAALASQAAALPVQPEPTDAQMLDWRPFPETQPAKTMECLVYAEFPESSHGKYVYEAHSRYLALHWRGKWTAKGNDISRHVRAWAILTPPRAALSSFNTTKEPR